jgi:drug/metabolite transporter (DMT)-like permease
MSKFAMGNVLLIGSMLCTTVSHIMIKGLIDQAGEKSLTLSSLLELFTGPKLLRSVLAGSLLVAGFLLWALCLSRLTLSYAYPVASTSVLLIAIFSVVVLGETISPKMWAGTALILVGVVLLRPAG